MRLAHAPFLLALALAACAGELGADDRADGATTSTSDAAPPGTPDAAPGPDATPLPLPAIGFADYHSQDQIAAYLRAAAEARPHTTSFEVLGESAEGREVAIVVIDATSAPGAPSVYLNGTHHGNEQIATEVPLGVIDALLRGEDPRVAAVLDQLIVVVQPLVNPDGHAAYTREDSLGRDPNRDYAYPERNAAQSFDLVEIRLVRDLQQRFAFHGALAYHSGIEEVIWPWCHTGNPTADADLLATLAETTATAMGMDRWMQSYDDYPASGEYIDYAYMEHRTLALTVELSDDPTPPASQLDLYVERGVEGSLAFLHALVLEHAHLLPLAPAAPQFGGRAARVVDGERQE
jgi:predicted deacylase